MSSSYLFCLRKVPSTFTIGRAFGAHVAPRLPFTAYNVKGATLATSSSITCGAPIKLLLLSHHQPSYVGSRTINWPQSRSPAASSNILAGPNSKAKLYHTDFKATEAAEFRKWETWLSPRNFRRKQINQHFDLPYVFRIFDGLLFRGRLRNLVVLRWVDAPMGKPEQLSRNTSITDIRRWPCALIELTRSLCNGPWAGATIQERLEAMLYEMTRVYFLMYISRGQSGHGPLFRKFLRRVEEEANHTLRGFSGLWQMESPRR